MRLKSFLYQHVLPVFVVLKTLSSLQIYLSLLCILIPCRFSWVMSLTVYVCPPCSVTCVFHMPFHYSMKPAMPRYRPLIYSEEEEGEI